MPRLLKPAGVSRPAILFIAPIGQFVSFREEYCSIFAGHQVVEIPYVIPYFKPSEGEERCLDGSSERLTQTVAVSR
jgi:hypothetical protein